MNTGVVVHVTIRSTHGTRSHDLLLEQTEATLYDVMTALAQAEWSRDLFGEAEGRTILLPGYMMVLEKRMVQRWEAEDTPVASGMELRFAQVVPGG
jgi:hypothetical protein